MEQRENELFEIYEKVNLDSVQAVKGKAEQYFKSKAWIYAVLDYVVCFGVYEHQQFLLKPGNQKEFIPLEWQYLQELRVFDRNGELRLLSVKERWAGRFRGSVSAGGNTDRESKEYCIDECQKLWGKAKAGGIIDDSLWSLLTSDRGTRIWVPIRMKEQEEAAICVRRFMRVPTADSPELVYQTDIRMMDFCIWGEDKVEGGQDENG